MHLIGLRDSKVYLYLLEKHMKSYAASAAVAASAAFNFSHLMIDPHHGAHKI